MLFDFKFKFTICYLHFVSISKTKNYNHISCLSAGKITPKSARYSMQYIDAYLFLVPYSYPVETRSICSSDDLQSLGEKLSRETSASKAARHDFDAQREHVKYLEKTDPKYPGHSK